MSIAQMAMASVLQEELKARKDQVEALRDGLDLCQKALAMMVSPDAIGRTTASVAFAEAVKAETIARRLLECRT